MKKTPPRSTRTTALPASVRLAALAAAVAVAGCAVGPDYRRPGTALPGAYDPAAKAAPDDSSTAVVRNDWWKLYNDPLLNQLVDAALTNNPNIRLVVARVEEARAVLREANASFFPEVDYSGVGGRGRSGVAGSPTSGASSGLSSSSATTTSTTTSGGSSVGGSTTTSGGSSGNSGVGGSSGGTSGLGVPVYGNLFHLEGTISYELDLWGRLRRASEAARASLLSTTYARDVTVLALESTVAQNYFALRSLDAQIHVNENTLQVVGESLDIAQKRLAAGYSSALDYAQAETLRAQTQVALRDLRRQRALQEHQLANLTSNLTLTIQPGGIEDIPVPAVPPPGLPSTLLQRRPDVARDEQLVVETNAQVGIAKAELFPTFSLTGAYGGQSFELSDLLKAPFRFWSFGLGISGPIFAGGKYVARLDEARSRDDEQVANYQTTVEGAFREVADALTDVAESNAAEPEVMTEVDAALRTLRLSRLRYQAGYSAYLDVLDATRQANAAEITLVQNRMARLNYTVDLFRTLGGGWDAGPAAQGAGAPVASVAPDATGTASVPAATTAVSSR